MKRGVSPIASVDGLIHSTFASARCKDSSLLRRVLIFAQAVRPGEDGDERIVELLDRRMTDRLLLDVDVFLDRV